MKSNGTGNFENSQAESLLYHILDELNRDMVYELNERHISRDTIIARMDVMAFLSEHYDFHPDIRLETFQQLKQEVIEDWNSDAPEWTERFEIISTTMDRLEAQIRRFMRNKPASDETIPE